MTVMLRISFSFIIVNPLQRALRAEAVSVDRGQPLASRLPIPARQVFDETVRPLGKDIVSRSKVRFLSKEFAQFQETVIVGNRVAINVFTQNAYSFLINDPKVAEGYKKYFELLWKIAKP